MFIKMEIMINNMNEQIHLLQHDIHVIQNKIRELSLDYKKTYVPLLKKFADTNARQDEALNYLSTWAAIWISFGGLLCTFLYVILIAKGPRGGGSGTNNVSYNTNESVTNSFIPENIPTNVAEVASENVVRHIPPNFIVPLGQNHDMGGRTLTEFIHNPSLTDSILNETERLLYNNMTVEQKVQKLMEVLNDAPDPEIMAELYTALGKTPPFF